MKKGLFISLLVFSNLAMAMGGKSPPPNNHSGKEQCAFYDSGKKEEHGPHYSLEECQSKHGSCQQRCFTYYNRCTVEGVRFEAVREGEKIVDKEVTRTYQGSHRDEGRALEIATRNCETDFPYNRYCVRKSCVEEADRTR